MIDQVEFQVRFVRDTVPELYHHVFTVGAVVTKLIGISGSLRRGSCALAAAHINRGHDRIIGNVPVYMNSREIRGRLEREGWTLLRIKGSHHIFRNPKTGMIISLPHPKKDLGQGLVSKIYRDANWPKD